MTEYRIVSMLLGNYNRPAFIGAAVPLEFLCGGPCTFGASMVSPTPVQVIE